MTIKTTAHLNFRGDARAALDRLGLPSALTRQRANGLNSMVGRIREAALAVQ